MDGHIYLTSASTTLGVYIFFTHEKYIPCSFDKIGWPEKNVLKNS